MILELEDLERSPAICTKRFSEVKINFIIGYLYDKNAYTGTGKKR